jgi:hypothetical protein
MAIVPAPYTDWRATEFRYAPSPPAHQPRDPPEVQHVTAPPKVCPCVADLPHVPPRLLSAVLSTPAALRTPGVCSGGDSAF